MNWASDRARTTKHVFPCCARRLFHQLSKTLAVHQTQIAFFAEFEDLCTASAEQTRSVFVHLHNASKLRLRRCFQQRHSPSTMLEPTTPQNLKNGQSHCAQYRPASKPTQSGRKNLLATSGQYIGNRQTACICHPTCAAQTCPSGSSRRRRAPN